MKHIVQFRKAAIGLLILLLITILTLTIPTKGLAQAVNYSPGGNIYIGMEQLALNEDELRAAYQANGGFAVVSLRYYVALPPGSLDQIQFPGTNGFILAPGNQYAIQMVNPKDTLGVVFAGNIQVLEGMSGRQKSVRQPADGLSYITRPAGNIDNVFHTPGESKPMQMMAATATGDLYIGGTQTHYGRRDVWTWAMAETPPVSGDAAVTGLNSAISTPCFVNNHNNGYDTIFIRRIAFVIHDIDKFIDQGGFEVIGDRSGACDGCYATNHWSLFMATTNGNIASGPIKCNEKDLASNDWFDSGNCGAIMQFTAGGVVVISKPQINIPAAWRPCPTYTIC